MQPQNRWPSRNNDSFEEDQHHLKQVESKFTVINDKQSVGLERGYCLHLHLFFFFLSWGLFLLGY